MRVALRRLLLAWFIATVPLSGEALTYERLVFFGDSLSDSGTNAFLIDNVLGPPAPPGTLRTPTPIPEPGFIPTYPYASNRYSNGPVWTESFAATVGGYAGRDYSRDAQSAFLGGSNFAFGGARMGPRGSTYGENVGDQVTTYLSVTGGTAAAGALHVVQGGGNDARDALSALGRGADPAPLISSYVTETFSVLNQLYASGAREILFVNVPDIGEAPAIQLLGPGAVDAATMIAAAMNAGVNDVLSTLAPELTRGLLRLDLFDLVNQVAANPAAFGLTDARSACAFSVACIANPDSTFFWDGIHPTTAGHTVIARAAFTAVVPEPATVLLVAIGLLGCAATRSRRSKRTVQ